MSVIKTKYGFKIFGKSKFCLKRLIKESKIIMVDKSKAVKPKPWYHGVKIKEVKMKDKILYCIVGGQTFAVLESNIVERALHGTSIIAKEVFAITTAVVPAPNGQVQHIMQISTMKDVLMRCDFISVLTEDSQLYRAIRSKITGIELVQ